MTKKVKIALAIDIDDNWCAMGWNKARMEELQEAAIDNVSANYTIYTIEVDIPIAEPKTLKGRLVQNDSRN